MWGGAGVNSLWALVRDAGLVERCSCLKYNIYWKSRPHARTLMHGPSHLAHSNPCARTLKPRSLAPPSNRAVLYPPAWSLQPSPLKPSYIISFNLAPHLRDPSESLRPRGGVPADPPSLPELDRGGRERARGGHAAHEAEPGGSGEKLSRSCPRAIPESGPQLVCLSLSFEPPILHIFLHFPKPRHLLLQGLGLRV